VAATNVFRDIQPKTHVIGSRGLTHDDASVLTLFVESGDPGWIPSASSRWVGCVTEQHGSIRSCKSGFDSRPAHQAVKEAYTRSADLTADFRGALLWKRVSAWPDQWAKPGLWPLDKSNPI